MKKFLLFIFCLLNINFAFADTTNDAIQHIAQRFYQNRNLPGLAVVTSDANGQLKFYTFGYANAETNQPITKDTLFEIASVTKVFTATILGLDVNAGKLTLNDKIGPYLPNDLNNPQLPVANITFQQLATHTASMPEDPPMLLGRGYRGYNRADLFSFLANWQPQYQPGTHWKYSDVGFGVLGYALSGVNKTPFKQLMQTDVLDPLNMTHTFYQVPASEEQNYAQGYKRNGGLAPRWADLPWRDSAGALRSTIVDMGKFLQANLGQGSANATLKQAMQTAQKPLVNANVRMQQGLGWQITSLPNGMQEVAKDGGSAGFSTFITMIPAQHVGVVIIANRNRVAVGKLARHILLNMIHHPQQ